MRAPFCRHSSELGLQFTVNFYSLTFFSVGLISMRGMEKSLRITRNTILQNTGTFMIEFKADSQSDLWGELVAITQENTIKFNKAPSIAVS